MPISEKQMKILAFPYTKNYQALICDGAVRSGKTSIMTVAFVDWAMREFNNTNFGICGKTVGSAIKNIVIPYMALGYARKKYSIHFTRSDNKMIVKRGDVTNVFYVYGGKDESSYMLIQGVTLAGVLLDEVALMAQSFVEQALARCLSYKNRRYWFNCNPDNPSHWFYQNWIQQLEKHRALHLHFLLTDNPALDEESIQEAENTWDGVFYQRYVLGLWVAAEGVIYRRFADDPEKYIIDAAPPVQHVNIGVDFGGNKSATMFVATGFTRGYKQAIILDEEHRPAATENPETLNRAFVDFCRRIKQEYPMAFYSYCDSAEQILIRGLDVAVKRDNTGIQVVNALKTEITGRIRLVNSLMAQERFKVMRGCKELITALQVAVWDDKALDDVRLDNGTYNVDVLDATEYTLEPVANFLQVLR